MEKKKLFQYAVLLHPEKKEEKDSKSLKQETKILVGIKSALAESERIVLMKAIKEIPDQYSEDFNRIEIAIRPF